MYGLAGYLDNIDTAARACFLGFSLGLAIASCWALWTASDVSTTCPDRQMKIANRLLRSIALTLLAMLFYGFSQAR